MDLQRTGEVATLELLFVCPAVSVAFGIATQGHGRKIVGCNGIDDRVGGQHAGLHRHVDARKLQDVEHRRTIAQDHGAVGVELRLRVKGARRDALGAVSNQLCAVEQLAHELRGLELLRHQVRVVVRVFAAEVRHEAVRDQVVLHVIEKHPVHLGQPVGEQRTVDHAAGLVVFRLDPPNLFDAGFERLRVLAVHVEAIEKLLGAAAAHAFTEHRDPGQDVHAGLVGRFVTAVGRDAHVASADAEDAVAFGQDLGGGKARVDLNADLFALRAEPLHDIAQ